MAPNSQRNKRLQKAAKAKKKLPKDVDIPAAVPKRVGIRAAVSKRVDIFAMTPQDFDSGPAQPTEAEMLAGMVPPPSRSCPCPHCRAHYKEEFDADGNLGNPDEDGDFIDEDDDERNYIPQLRVPTAPQMDRRTVPNGVVVKASTTVSYDEPKRIPISSIPRGSAGCAGNALNPMTNVGAAGVDNRNMGIKTGPGVAGTAKKTNAGGPRYAIASPSRVHRLI
jgi:hypothetical protein